MTPLQILKEKMIIRALRVHGNEVTYQDLSEDFDDLLATDIDFGHLVAAVEEAMEEYVKQSLEGQVKQTA